MPTPTYSLWLVSECLICSTSKGPAMRTTPKIIAATAALLLSGGGAAVAVSASAPPHAVLSTTERGWCLRTATGELRSLWLDASTHKCPLPWFGPVSLGGAQGPAA